MSVEHEPVRVVDLHADLPLDVTKRRAKGERQVLERYHVEKLRKGLVTGLIAPIWVESSYKPASALKRGLQIAYALMEDLEESRSFRIVKNHDEFLDAEARSKIGLILGVEGGEIIEDDLGLLRIFHRLGVRCFGLVWNQRNLMADGWDHVKDDRGLTDFGKQAVEELDRLGIIVDLAHLAPRGFWDVLNVAKHPVIVSHTCTSRYPSLRSMTDDQLRAVASNGGIVGIFAVNTGAATVTMPDLKTYCDHIEYAVKISGPEHVGLGPDFYDYFLQDLREEYADKDFQLVRGLEDHSKLGAVVNELSRRGLSEEEIRLIARDNFVRIFKEVVR